MRFVPDFAALERIYEKHAGLGAELQLINTVFTFLRDKKGFFNSPGTANSINNLVQRFADEVSNKQKPHPEQPQPQPTVEKKTVPFPKQTEVGCVFL